MIYDGVTREPHCYTTPWNTYPGGDRRRPASPLWPVADYRRFRAMTRRMRQEIFHVLSDLSECSPKTRLGQLVANLSYLAKGPTNEAIWDVEDGELLAAARKHLIELRNKEVSAA